jgi:hypothetical protein
MRGEVFRHRAAGVAALARRSLARHPACPTRSERGATLTRAWRSTLARDACFPGVSSRRRTAELAVVAAAGRPAGPAVASTRLAYLRRRPSARPRCPKHIHDGGGARRGRPSPSWREGGGRRRQPAPWDDGAAGPGAWGEIALDRGRRDRGLFRPQAGGGGGGPHLPMLLARAASRVSRRGARRRPRPCGSGTAASQAPEVLQPWRRTHEGFYLTRIPTTLRHPAFGGGMRARAPAARGLRGRPMPRSCCPTTPCATGSCSSSSSAWGPSAGATRGPSCSSPWRAASTRARRPKTAARREAREEAGLDPATRSST